jgi:iron complex transport system ATP-binding protein
LGVNIKLSVENLSFGYNGVAVLHNVSFQTRSGCLVSLVGPNGAGKSTLLRCISRLLTPSTGHILLDGRNIRQFGRREIARRLAYVPQTIHRVFPHPVFDVVLMGRHPHLGWKSSRQDKEKVWDILDMLGLLDLAMNSFTELSGGQRQKVLIARALAQETGLILLDEPTSNLDIWHQLDVLNIVRRLVEEKGITVITAMHDLNLAARYSHDLLMLKNGSVQMNGAPQTVLTRDSIAAVYHVDARIASMGDIPYVIPMRQRSTLAANEWEDRTV